MPKDPLKVMCNMWRPDNHLQDDIKWMKVLNWRNGVTHTLALTLMWLYWFFYLIVMCFPLQVPLVRWLTWQRIMFRFFTYRKKPLKILQLWLNKIEAICFLRLIKMSLWKQETITLFQTTKKKVVCLHMHISTCEIVLSSYFEMLWDFLSTEGY